MLFMTVSLFTVLFSVAFWILGVNPLGTYIVSMSLFIFSLLLFPLSSLLDGNKKEKRRVLIDFIPNIIATFIHSAIYCYADIVGLLHCGNQKVWKKTAHRVTTMETTETPILQEVATTKEENIKEEQNEKD